MVRWFYAAGCQILWQPQNLAKLLSNCGSWKEEGSRVSKSSQCLASSKHVGLEFPSFQPFLLCYSSTGPSISKQSNILKRLFQTKIYIRRKVMTKKKNKVHVLAQSFRDAQSISLSVLCLFQGLWLRWVCVSVCCSVCRPGISVAAEASSSSEAAKRRRWLS